MTMPDSQDGILSVISQQVSQILSKQGEQGEKLAVISEQLRDLPDHESRLRVLEASASQTAGVRDWWARAVAGAAVLGAVGSAVAVYLHH